MPLAPHPLAKTEADPGQPRSTPTSAFEEARRACGRIAQSQATALLTGDTAKGREVFARLIHAASGRSHTPFIAVACNTIPEALLESEIFGYVKGAFPGAAHPRRGRLAMAQGGTLYLDEIGDLRLGLQAGLLRVMQEHRYEPVGSSESVLTDVRIVVATSRDLAEKVRVGRFRRDLYYRLSVCPVRLPSVG
jgi:transcriptional regulator with GAF, ATPase, and Fis domain